MPIWWLSWLGHRSSDSESSYVGVISRLNDSFFGGVGRRAGDLSKRTNPSEWGVGLHKETLLRDMIRRTDVFTMVFYTYVIALGAIIGGLFLAFFTPPWHDLLLLPASSWAWIAVATLLASATFALALAAVSMLRSREAILKGRVFQEFLYDHWMKHDARPRTLHKFCRLAFESAKSGKVQFPGESPDDRADIDKHLNPARDFERP